MLVTNAILMNRNLAQSLYANNVNISRVSLDTYRQSEYNSIRSIENGFENALKGIKHMVDADIKVIIRYTLTKRNISDLLGTYKLCQDLNVSEFQLRVVSPYGRSSMHYMPNIDDIKMAFDNLFAIEDQLTIATPCFFMGPCTKIEISNRMKECPCGREWVYMVIDGNMYPCNYFPEYTRLGNFYIDDINELWKSNPYLYKIRTHRPEECSKCLSWSKCFNQCQGLIYTFTDDLKTTCFKAIYGKGAA